MHKKDFKLKNVHVTSGKISTFKVKQKEVKITLQSTFVLKNSKFITKIK